MIDGRRARLIRHGLQLATAIAALALVFGCAVIMGLLISMAAVAEWNVVR